MEEIFNETRPDEHVWKIKKYFILSHAWEIKLLQQQSGAKIETTLFREDQNMYQYYNNIYK